MRKNLLMAVNLAALLLFVWASNLFAQQLEWQRDYAGAINKTIRIRMNLAKSGKSLSGSYFYEKVGKPIVLSGSLNGQQFTLKEYDGNGKTTGTFSGRFVTDDTLEGTWSNADASKTFPFSLKMGESTSRPPAANPSAIDGKYERLDAKGRIEKESGAELNVEQQANGMTLVAGEAVLVVNAKTGNVRTGGITATAKLAGNKLHLSEGNDGCEMTIVFGKGTLEVTEDNGQCGGLGVSFIGTYKRTGAPKFQ